MTKKNITKFIVFIIITVLAVVSLAACGSTAANKGSSTTSDKSSSSVTGSDKISIVTTIFPQYDFIRQIVGDKADVTMLLKPGAESHSYEPTPQDIKMIQNSDLFIYTGGENDVWVDDILSSMGEDKPDTIKLLDCVETVNEELVEGMEDEHEHEHEEEHKDVDESEDYHDDVEHEDGHEHSESEEHEDHEHEHEVDEHVWTSPKNAIEIVNKITDKLCNIDAKNADSYQENSSAYIVQLQNLDSEFKAVVDNAKRKTILFGDRFPLRYFADEYGLNYYAAFSGCSTETEADASTIAFLVNKVKEENIPVVFTIELSNGKIADSICEDTGAKKLTFYSCHNVTKEQMEDGATYLSMMTENVDSLKEALN